MAGFKSKVSGDIVRCQQCGLEVSKSSSSAKAFDFHREKAPHCPFIQSKTSSGPSDKRFAVGTENHVGNNLKGNKHENPSEHKIIEGCQIFTAACNPAYIEELRRHATFVTWPHENLPTIDDLVRAGFFYCGVKTIVTCFYCNGSLQHWEPDGNPMIEHARWFPHCAYAKQLCGDELYRKIQESERAQHERMEAKTANSETANDNRPATTDRQLLAPDENTLSRLVAARLDLPISQHLLDKNFKLTITKRCWEDQLRLKQDDSASAIDLSEYVVVSHTDLWENSFILQEQIEHSDNGKETIVLLTIEKERTKEQNEIEGLQTLADLDQSTSQTLDDLDQSTSQTQKNPICESHPSLEPSLFNQESLSNSFSTNLTHRRFSTLLTASQSNTLLNTRAIQDVQRRTFSHWPSSSNLPLESMIDVGFFHCNKADRVICLSCNLICEGWTAGVDDPFEVHRTISPHCPYIQKKLGHPSNKVVPIINETAIPQTSSNYPSRGDKPSLSQFDQIAYTAATNSRYCHVKERKASFTTWPTTNSPTHDDLARAGFFYDGKETTVHCFYCNGALRNWGPNDNPISEHVRRFPYCAYARQVCDDQIYHQMQKAQREREENDKTNETHTHFPQLSIPDEDTLTRLVGERLDLPVSQCLLNNNFKFSIIRRCWEDQLRLKKCDFHSDDDLFIACLIFQKQIEHINDNIVVPSERMQQMQEQRIHDMNNGTNQRLGPVQSIAAPSSSL